MEHFKDHLKKKIVSELRLIFNGADFKLNLGIKNKSDNSIVTIIDTIISSLVKEEIRKIDEFKDFVFYSEEDHDELEFPCIVLDPVDGTRELSQGLPECAVSLAIMYTSRINDERNWGWIFNPFSGFEIDSKQDFCQAQNANKNGLMGMVSRTEWDKGLYIKKTDNILIHPKGSIALKLGLLSAGAIDFVISKRPKNIWDIAAGSIICSKRNIKTWQDKSMVLNLDYKKFEAPLVWATEEVFTLLKKDQI